MFKTSKSDCGFLPLFALALAVLAGLAHVDVIRASELNKRISKQFELGAKNTPPALAAAKSQYEQLKRFNPRDPRIDYAYGVVLVNQHKYRDALSLLSRYLETNEADLNANRVRIWAQLQDRRFADVLAAMVALSETFPRDPNAQVDPQFVETAHFMGIVFGYLELVRPGVGDTAITIEE